MTFRAQEIIGGGLSLVAAALVTTMIFWMGRNARAMKHELETSMAGSLAKDAKGWGVVWIAVLAVGREGVETALFIWATVRSSIEQTAFLTTAGV
ncbi:FTR1 family protein, partial [Rothia kristinae]|uniref:FTR1 family protein n=1 Tax=Rothia kristinae TaxID=37923 RepID=UPI000B277A54